ncbi:MAG TPA: transposase [Chitinophagales bacterium]|nr:transposase [Chitinophagales bacterium]
MSTGYQIIEQDKAYFVTLQVVDWVDVFSREIYRKIIVENLCFCVQHKGLEIYGWVIMSNHVHLMLRSKTAKLSNTLRDFKSYTAKVILNKISDSQESRKEWMLRQFKSATIRHKRNTEYQFWTHENHAEFLFSEKFIGQKLRYLHNNPVRAGIVSKAEHYKYSSAVDYGDEDGLIPIVRLFVKWKTY